MPAGIRALAEGMSAKSQLHLLDISDNEVGPEGARSLAAALERAQGLGILRLRGNRIGDEGAAALSGAIASSGLYELDAGHNKVRRCAHGSHLVYQRIVMHISMEVNSSARMHCQAQ